MSSRLICAQLLSKFQDERSRVTRYVYTRDCKGGTIEFRAIDGSNENDDQIAFSQEQNHVYDLVKSGKNVFFTGPAGKLYACVLQFRDNF